MSAEDREDLAALFTRIARGLADAERPLLEARGLTMWEYIALSHLSSAPALTQLGLAQAIRYDKTRLIGLLDALESRGLLTRRPDEADRRARVVRITPRGASQLTAARADIRAMEESALAQLSAPQRRALMAALPALPALAAGIASPG